MSAGRRSASASGSWWRLPGRTWPTRTCWCWTKQPVRWIRPGRYGCTAPLDAVTRDRTTVAIAHRLSTAQSADEVIVIDKGRIVQRGHPTELVGDADSVYGKLFASWLEQTR